ncbi:MAG: hypothetical protein H0V42_08785, partial [Nocardioidaceae bacterium]|nr:hypothetical protein [Nocardioidaceae bacterium]
MNVPNRRARRCLSFAVAIATLAMAGVPVTPSVIAEQRHTPVQQQATDWEAVAQALGKPGQIMP